MLATQASLYTASSYWEHHGCTRNHQHYHTLGNFPRKCTRRKVPWYFHLSRSMVHGKSRFHRPTLGRAPNHLYSPCSNILYLVLIRTLNLWRKCSRSRFHRCNDISSLEWGSHRLVDRSMPLVLGLHRLQFHYCHSLGVRSLGLLHR